MKVALTILAAVGWLALPLAPCFADNPSLAETRVKAERGDAVAQHNLGLMYYEGEGMPRDYAEAVKWWRMAAEQGEAKAQFNLGLMYENGEGVPRDYVQAYMWLSLAAAQGDEESRKLLDSTERGMTADQIAEAQKRAAAWKPTGN